MKEHFKLLEDTIGAIDYYDTVAKELVANKRIPAEVVNYLQAQSREKIQSLNEALTEKGWLLASDSRMQKMQNKLLDADWMEEEIEIESLHEFYGAAIYEIAEFAQNLQYQFTSMESDVHELRRKLRWLSIYPQCLRGAIQFGKNITTVKHLTKYSTKEIVGSPFNIMPEPGAAKYVLLLEQDYFFALSWMIAQLGILKDKGLHVIAVKEALQQTSTMDEETALKKTIQWLGTSHEKLPDLLEKAGHISKVYFEEQNLEHLVMHIRKLR